MFLKSIRLENVRCIEDAQISFATKNKSNRQWTLITGDNGSGKSTVLKAAALLMCGSEALLDVVHHPGSWVRNGCDTCRISGVVTTARGEERKLVLTLGKDQSLRQMLKDNAKSLKRLDDALEHTNRSYLTVAYGPSRHSDVSGGGIGHELFHHPRVQAMATLFADHAKMIPFDAWVINLANREKTGGVKIIREALDGLLPNVTFRAIEKRQIMFNTPDGPVPLQYLSAGYQNVIGFVGDLLYRITEIFDDYKNPLATRGLLLIDELGLHLHPTWQRMLMTFLTEKLPNFQIVATTNSPVLAHQAGENELHYLLRDKAKASPTMHHFEGSPNQLLLHQLILSPVFGVETADSHEVEANRKEYRKLSKKSGKTAKDKREIAKLKNELAETADWDEVLPVDKEMKALLKKIQSKLPAK